MIAESGEGRRGDPAGRTNAGTSSCSFYSHEYIKLTHLLAKVENNFDRMIAILEDVEEVR